jgi:hypothetical protein
VTEVPQPDVAGRQVQCPACTRTFAATDGVLPRHGTGETTDYAGVVTVQWPCPGSGVTIKGSHE